LKLFSDKIILIKKKTTNYLPAIMFVFHIVAQKTFIHSKKKFIYCEIKKKQKTEGF